jgi:hypothetical protein
MAKAKPTSIHAIQSELPGLTNVVARVASRAGPLHSGTRTRTQRRPPARRRIAASECPVRHGAYVARVGYPYPHDINVGPPNVLSDTGLRGPAGYSYPYDINVGPPNVLSDTGPMWPRPVIHIHMTLTWGRPVPRPPCPPAHTLWRPYIRRGQWAPTQTIGSQISEAHFISLSEMKRSSSLCLLLVLAQVLFQVSSASSSWHRTPSSKISCFLIAHILFELTRAAICLCRAGVQLGVVINHRCAEHKDALRGRHPR